MADTKISNLTGLAAAPATDDVFALVDTSASSTKKLDAKYLVRDSGGSGAIVTGAFTLTLQQSMQAAGRNVANTFTAAQTIGNLNLNGNVIASTSGAVTVTPLAGQNLNVNLSTTGDFVVNTNQFYIDTSTGFSGIGTTGPGNLLHVNYSSDESSGDGGVLITNSGLFAALRAWDREIGRVQFRSGLITTRVSGITGYVPANSAGISSNALKFYVSIGDVTSTAMVIRESGNVLIGTETNVTSALLQLGGTTGALLLSRLTTDQRDVDLTTPINGMILYNSSTNKFQGYENGTWVNLI